MNNMNQNEERAKRLFCITKYGRIPIMKCVYVDTARDIECYLNKNKRNKSKNEGKKDDEYDRKSQHR